jgi:Fur family zinc uptake transcriptional regulator
MINRKPIILFMLQKPDPLATLYNVGIHRGGRWLVCGVSLLSRLLLPGFSQKAVNTIDTARRTGEFRNGARLMNEHVHEAVDLTWNQSLVMGALTRSREPLSAYTILDQLRDNGFRAPLQVYRALEKLVEFGLVHRLESLNAFVACSHPGCDGDDTIAFMIREKCGQVNEIADKAMTKRLRKLVAEARFTLQKATIELRGICHACHVT